MTTFEPSHSASTRPGLMAAGSTGLSPADQLPSINFGFDALKQRMSNFTQKFDSYIDRERKKVLEERNSFRANIAEIHEDQRMRRKDVEILHQKSSTHEQILAKEQAETAEMHAAISAVQKQRDASQLNHDRLEAQLAETKAAIQRKLAAQAEYAKSVDAQERQNGPELDFWQDYLCLRIEGAGINDRLKFVYTHIDERDWEREGWFELDCASREYRVVTCRPKVDAARLEKAVDKLNDLRDLAPFLKDMRELFVSAMK